MLEFDAETTRLLDSCYLGADITRRRQASFDALRPLPGEMIADIGCGNGLLALDLGRAVGPAGRVVGIEPSADMRASARTRCAGLPAVEIVDGTAARIPLADGSVDKAVSVQVFEYVADVPGALAEAHRVLRPGGRLVIGDNHFDSLAWYSDHPGRMAAMIRAWEGHAENSRLPATLPGLLRAAGFLVSRVETATVVDIDLKPDGLAFMMLRLMERFAVDQAGIASDLVADWASEQDSLAEEGRFFFSLSHFVTIARKPDG